MSLPADQVESSVAFALSVPPVPAAPQALDGRIMIVDDEPVNIKVVQKYLREAGYHDFVTTSDSREALGLVRRARPDLILLDIMMPHVDGLQILAAIRGEPSIAHLPVLILTAAADDQTRLQALELRATDFLSKPVRQLELTPRVRNALILKTHHDQMVAYSRRLEEEVQRRTMEVVRSREEVMHVLACAAEYRDRETGNHVLRVGRYAGIIARQLGLPLRRVELLEQAAILHDVGKIGIPDAILLKPGKLTAEEFREMQRHCEIGVNILRATPAEGASALGSRDSGIQSPILQTAAVLALSHHERWDGTGYPRGLKGEEIPLEGRITAVADVFDALGSERPYKSAFPLERCFEILEEGRGTHFDPAVLDAFFARAKEVIRVALDLADA